MIDLGARWVNGGGSDRLGPDPAAPKRSTPGPWDALLVLYAVLAALCRPLTAPAAAAVLMPGLALLALMVWRVPARRPADFERSAALTWLALALLLGGWEATTLVWGNDSAHPTLSRLLDPVLATYPGRLLGWLGWLAMGRWLVTR